MPGKHPASVCQNMGGKNCHNCGSCAEDYKQFPGYQYDFVGKPEKTETSSNIDEAAIAEIVKKVIAEMK